MYKKFRVNHNGLLMQGVGEPKSSGLSATLGVLLCGPGWRSESELICSGPRNRSHRLGYGNIYQVLIVLG